VDEGSRWSEEVAVVKEFESCVSNALPHTRIEKTRIKVIPSPSIGAVQPYEVTALTSDVLSDALSRTITIHSAIARFG